MRQSPVSQMSNNICAFHPFLRLRQPIDPTAYPEPREFKSQQLYIFPFTFVVPDRLLPQNCSHPTSDEYVKAAHTQLPPSFGDPMVCGDKGALIDDMAPMMSEIAYKIKVSVVKLNETSTTTTASFHTLSSIAKKVRIVPATSEQPPLEVEYNFTDHYHTRREKGVRKALLGGKSGRLVVTAAQPKPLQLPARGTTTDATANSHVKLHVRFDPENDSDQPPQLRSLLSKLRVLTYYSSIPWTTFPSKKAALACNNASQGLYTETVGLSSLCVVSAQWQKHDQKGIHHPQGSSRSSLESSSSEERLSPSSACLGKSFYTASILVPISLPSNKAFVPTFHSCLISRVYTLDMSLTYQSPGTKLLTPSISLKIPIQITSAPGDGIAPEEDPSTSILPAVQIEDEYYRPRNIALPPSEGSSRTNSVAMQDDTQPLTHDNDNGNDNAPPEYSAVPSASRVRVSTSLSPSWSAGRFP